MLDNLGRWKKPHRVGQTPFTDTMDRCERQGYVPSHQRIAALISAGLQTQVARDELWDIVSKTEPEMLKDLPPIPPIRRHLDSDLADIQQVSRVYSSRRREIEVRLREQRMKELEKTLVVSTTTPKIEPTTPPEKPA